MKKWINEHKIIFSILVILIFGLIAIVAFMIINSNEQSCNYVSDGYIDANGSVIEGEVKCNPKWNLFK
jgi:hypothetical protein